MNDAAAVRVPRGSVYKERGRWVAELVWPGRSIRKRWTEGTKRDADARLQAFRADLGAGLNPSAVTLSSLVAAYLKNLGRTKKQSTMDFCAWCLRHVTDTLGELKVADITAQDVEKVMHALQAKGLSPRSQRAVRTQFRAVMQRALRDRLVPSNVVELVEAPRHAKRRLELPPVDDVVALLDKMREKDHTYWPVLWACLGGALRIGEARSLRVADVQGDFVLVTGQLSRDGTWSTPKTDAGVRDVPIGPRLRAAVDEGTKRRAAWSARGPWLFCGPNGEPLSPFGAYQAWTKAQGKEWGEVRVTVHGLRHLALSRLITQEGISVADAAAYAGHSDSRVVAETYAHVLADHRDRLRKAIEANGVG